MGALLNIDEILLSPQVRMCSVAVPGTSRNNDSGNREPNGDRSPNNPCPEAMVSSHYFGNLISSEVEEYPDMVTGGPEEIRKRSHSWQEFKKRFPTAPLGLRQENKKRALYKSATILQ